VSRLAEPDVPARCEFDDSFPPDVDAATRRQLAHCRRETARDVLVALADGPTWPPTLAADLGIARSTLE